MRIDKTIKGEKFCYYVQFIPNTMTASVRYFQSDESIIGKISDDFKWILLPDTYMSPYISGIGKVKVSKLKLEKQYQAEARDWNDGQIKSKNTTIETPIEKAKAIGIQITDNRNLDMGFYIVNDNPEYCFLSYRSDMGFYINMGSCCFTTKKQADKFQNKFNALVDLMEELNTSLETEK